MGQYYKAYVEPLDKPPIVLDAWSYENGAKLMEHSWLGNEFVNAVISRIEKRPARVAWVGDYSDDTDNNDLKCDRKVFDTCWGENSTTSKVTIFDKSLFCVESEEPFDGIEIVGTGYFVNHTKSQYIDLKQYAQEARCSHGWVVNPLPLLTAVGNGLGGGDYRGINTSMVGYWYLDKLEFTRDSAPKNYANVTDDCIFRE